MKKYYKLLIFISLLSIFIFLSWDSWDEIINEVSKKPLKIILLISLFSSGYFLFDGIIITSVAKIYKKDFSLLNGICCSYYCGFFRLATFGSGTGVAEIYYMTKNDIPAAISTGMSLSKYIIQKVAIAFFGLSGYFIFFNKFQKILGDYNKYVFVGAVTAFFIVIVLILISTSSHFGKIIIGASNKIPLKNPSFINKRSGLKDQINTLHKETKVLFKHKWIILICFFSNLIKLSFWFIIPLILYGNTLSFSPLEIIFLMAFIYMLAGVIPTPSGIGAIELLFITFFGVLSNNAIAASNILSFRFATALVPFFVGFIYYLYFTKKKS